jgi:hypothetical protein
MDTTTDDNKTAKEVYRKCEPIFVTNWKPLEEVMTRRGNVNECGHYMFMYSENKDSLEKHFYKHKSSRRYITLDNEGNFYIGTKKVTEEQAFDYVLN